PEVVVRQLGQNVRLVTADERHLPPPAPQRAQERLERGLCPLDPSRMKGKGDGKALEAHPPPLQGGLDSLEVRLLCRNDEVSREVDARQFASAAEKVLGEEGRIGQDGDHASGLATLLEGLRLTDQD